MTLLPLAQGAEALLGPYWSATEQNHVIYESRLELARLLHADFDVAVRRIAAQPFLLRTVISGTERKYVSDFLLQTESGPVVVDVKPSSSTSHPRIAFTFAWTPPPASGDCG